MPNPTRRETLRLALAGPVTATVASADDTLSKQYEVCKLRGHVATSWGSRHGITSVDAVYHEIADQPQGVATQPGHRVNGEWQICWYCKKQFRTVEYLEERDA